MLSAAAAQAADPLPSWNHGPAKKAITDFVAAVTKEGGPNFVPVPERIATFDNDGTLWAEQSRCISSSSSPMDRLKALAPKSIPEWQTIEPFASAPRGDTRAVTSAGVKGFLEFTAATRTPA